MGNLLDLFVFKYNRTDFHELNLDWLISDVKTLAETLNNFVALNSIKFADPIQWNISKQYEAITVVVDPATGTAYLSSRPVPSGVAITNPDYWTVIFDLDIAQANNNITLRDDGNNVQATFDSVAGDWLLWNGTLYRVTRQIDITAAYVVGYNLERYTVELFIKDYVDGLNQLITDLKDEVGSLDDLTTTDKTSIVNAINELVDASTTLSGLITNVSNDLDELESIRFYMHNYDDFSSLAADVNAVTRACIIIDTDVTVDTAVSFNVPVHILGDANNHVLSLDANINILHDDFKLENVRVEVLNGSIIIGQDSGPLNYFSIINNIFHAPTDSTPHYAINVIRAGNGNISGNIFYSDTPSNQQLYCIYHEQTASTRWFQNTSITNNIFRSVYSMLYITGRVNPEQCAGIEFSNNNSIWVEKAIHLESSDHFRICDNIIDYNIDPIYLVSPNGIKILDNYIFSSMTATSCIDIVIDGFAEAIVIENNYIWNNTEYGGANITYGLKITTNEARIINSINVNNNFFRNFRYCIYIAVNTHGTHICNNAFYDASYSVTYDDTNYSQTQSYAYSNFIESNVGTPVTGIPISEMLAEYTHSVTVPAGSSTVEISSATLKGQGTNTTALQLITPSNAIFGYVTIANDTRNAVVKLTANVASNTTMYVRELYRLTRYA